MILPAQLEKIIELHNLAKESAETFHKKRFAYAEVEKLLKNKIFVGIAGLRGVGKTVLLRQLSRHYENSVYVSMDTLDPSIGLFELAKELDKSYKTRYLLIDEIHNSRNWQIDIKKIYDFLDIRVVFTSSASIEIIKSKHDLSRRVAIVNLLLFSFREYLFFKKGVLIGAMSLEEIVSKYAQLYQKVYQFEPEFNEFCIRGALPAFLSAPVPQTIKNIAEKIITADLLIFGKLNAEDIFNIRNILRFLSRSPVDVCSYSTIARNAGISKYKAQEYIGLLEQAFLLKAILPYGSNVTREPKILYSLPFRVYFSDGTENDKIIGALREEFFIHHMASLDADINYLKSERGEKLPDYLVFYKNKKLVFEIGGAGKTRKQLKGISSREKFILSQPADLKKGIPLILLGFLY